MEKKRFKVRVNWHGEVMDFYTVTVNERAALKNVVSQLALKVGRTRYAVRQYLMNENFRRMEVVE